MDKIEIEVVELQVRERLIHSPGDIDLSFLASAQHTNSRATRGRSPLHVFAFVKSIPKLPDYKQRRSVYEARVDGVCNTLPNLGLILVDPDQLHTCMHEHWHDGHTARGDD